MRHLLYILLILLQANLFAQNCPQPDYCDRSCWDATNMHPKDSTPSITAPSHIIIHHSGDDNLWPDGTDYKKVIQGYWDFHVNTRGWDDIGYNWLIDRNGTIYEGRGDKVQGAHFSCMNHQTTGICLIGNFNIEDPTASMIDALQKFIAWEADDKNIDPSATKTHASSSLNLHTVSGHKDGNSSTNSCSSTDCPGSGLYLILADIRSYSHAIWETCSQDTMNVPTSIYLVNDPLSIVYPNPTNGIIYIPAVIRTIEIYNTQGILIKKIPTLTNNQIDISTLENGMYFLKIPAFEKAIAISKY